MAGFNNIIGHEKAVESLQNAIMLGKVSHAYIFSGEDGSGKKTLADAFAMTLQCEKGGKEACMNCPSCKKALTRNHPDIIYLKPEKDNVIKVDDIREQINNDMAIKPYSGNKKIYIINHADRMNEAAQNALLKTIEEPPEYGIIILLSENEEKFLPTIRSRCVTIEIRPVKDELIKEYLIKTLNVPEEEAAICAAFAQGNIGKAARLSGSEDFNAIKNETLQLVKRIRDMELAELTAAIKNIAEYKIGINDYFDIITIWYRDILVYKATMDANKIIFQDEIYEIKKQSSVSSYDGLDRIINAINTCKNEIQANVKVELALEKMLLTIKEN